MNQSIEETLRLERARLADLLEAARLARDILGKLAPDTWRIGVYDRLVAAITVVEHTRPVPAQETASPLSTQTTSEERIMMGNSCPEMEEIASREFDADLCPECRCELHEIVPAPENSLHIGPCCHWKCGSTRQEWPNSDTKTQFKQSDACRIRQLEDGILAELARYYLAEGEEEHPLCSLVKNRMYCHGCSVAGGADKPIYHLPPVCS